MNEILLLILLPVFILPMSFIGAYLGSVIGDWLCTPPHVKKWRRHEKGLR